MIKKSYFFFIIYAKIIFIFIYFFISIFILLEEYYNYDPRIINKDQFLNENGGFFIAEFEIFILIFFIIVIVCLSLIILKIRSDYFLYKNIIKETVLFLNNDKLNNNKNRFIDILEASYLKQEKIKFYNNLFHKIIYNNYDKCIEYDFKEGLVNITDKNYANSLDFNMVYINKYNNNMEKEVYITEFLESENLNLIMKIHIDDVHQFKESFKDIFYNIENRIDLNCRISTGIEKNKWFKIKLLGFYNDDNICYKIMNLCINVNNNIEILNDYNKNKELLKDIQNISKVGLWDYNIDNNELNLSNNIKEEFSLNENVIYLDNIIDNLEKKDQIKLQTILFNCVNYHQEIINVEFLIHEFSIKEDLYLLINGKKRGDKYNTTNKIIGTVQNITLRKTEEKELKIAKEKAEIGERTKSTFLANVTHEIRTPLNSIIGFSSILKNQVAFNPELKKFTDSIITSSNTLLDMINDILDLSKIESGGILGVNHSECNLKMELLKTVNIFKYEAKENLEILYNIDENIPSHIIFDVKRLKQVLMNIISNAIKFTKKGFVKFHAIATNIDKNKLDLCFIIEDTGVGVSEENKKNIFKPFFQEGQEKGNYGGTGLGLSIVKNIVDRLNGSIEVESELGKGTRFIVDIKNIEISEKDVKNDIIMDIDIDKNYNLDNYNLKEYNKEKLKDILIKLKTLDSEIDILLKIKSIKNIKRFVNSLKEFEDSGIKFLDDYIKDFELSYNTMDLKNINIMLKEYKKMLLLIEEL